MDLVSSVPKIDPEKFEEMMNANMKVNIGAHFFPAGQRLHVYIFPCLFLIPQYIDKYEKNPTTAT